LTKKRIISNEMLVNDVVGFCVITHNSLNIMGFC
jgi:hypothetical protein